MAHPAGNEARPPAAGARPRGAGPPPRPPFRKEAGQRVRTPPHQRSSEPRDYFNAYYPGYGLSSGGHSERDSGILTFVGACLTFALLTLCFVAPAVLMRSCL